MAGDAKQQKIEALFNEGKKCSAAKDHKTALAKYSECHRMCVDKYGKEAAYTLGIFYYVALENAKLGDYKKALQLYEECYNSQKKVSGELNLNTAGTLFEIARVNYELGNYEKSLQLFKRCDDLFGKIAGGKDFAESTRKWLTLVSGKVDKKANVPEKADFPKKAEKSNSAESHSDLFNNAYEYSKAGNHEKALELFEKCYSLRNKTFGENDSQTLSAMVWLGYTYSELGKYKDAQVILEKCYELRLKKYGESHPDTVNALHNLANAHSKLGNHRKSRELYGKWYRLRAKKPGEGKVDFSGFGDIGSASYIVGKTVIVTIFLEDSEHKWDFDRKDDYTSYKNTYIGTKIADKWLRQQIARYGHRAEFVWDWKVNRDLFVRGKINTGSDSSFGKDYRNKCKEYIDTHIDSGKLIKKYDADNILYQIVVNLPYIPEVRSCSSNYSEGVYYPYEISFLFPHYSKYYENNISPATIAHELLHSFSAPDLYDNGLGNEYGITAEYFKWAEKTKTNDIMRVTHDLATNKRLFDRITNEITEVTAYYIGLTKSSKTVEKWGFEKSHFCD